MSYQSRAQYVSRRHQNWSQGQNITRFSSPIKLGPVSHTVVVIMMVIVLALIYLTQATRATSYDYESQKIDSEIASLSTKKSDLEVENARLAALETIKNSAVAKEMAAPASTDYVR